MDRLFQSVLAVHIASGALALLVFWVPLVTRKGGRTHRRVGWVYVVAAATLAFTGFLLCIQLVSGGGPLRLRAGIFLAYVSVLAGASAQLGVRALRTKGRVGPLRGALDVVPPLLLVAGGIALAAFGIRESKVLYVLFAVLGVVLGVTHLRFWLTPRAHERESFLAHMNGMGTSCITTLTAFVVVNARRFGMHPFDLGLWAVPIGVLAVGLTILRRYYARRFPGYGTPGGAPRVESSRRAARQARLRRGRVQRRRGRRPGTGGKRHGRFEGRASRVAASSCTPRRGLL